MHYGCKMDAHFKIVIEKKSPLFLHCNENVSIDAKYYFLFNYFSIIGVKYDLNM